MLEEDIKPVIEEPKKSSMEILSELFSTFDAEPPVIVKKEKSEEKTKKHKKKKHKHKEKKHKHKEKKKSKKKKKSDSSNSDSESENEKTFTLADLLIKKEDNDENKIVIAGTDLRLHINSIKEEKSNISEHESGEIDSDDKSIKKKKKHHHKKHEKDKSHDNPKKRSRSKSSDHKSHHDTKNLKTEDFYKSNDSHHKPYHKQRDKSEDNKKKYKDDKFCDDHGNRDHRTDDVKRKIYDSYKEKDGSKIYDEHSSRSRSKYNPFYNSTRSDYSRDESYEQSRDRSRSDTRDRRKDRDRSPGIDKKKLLEIARKNALLMMKSGNLPSSLNLGVRTQEKVLAAIKAGGKTVEELTDFCKTLSRKEENRGDFDSSPEYRKNGSDSDTDQPFHHPFQIKDRPTTITMNIKNSVPLPIKSTQERSSELRLQFPVSSGQLHRKSENEWVPVNSSAKKDVPKPQPQNKPIPLAITAPEAPPKIMSNIEPVVTPTVALPPPLPITAPPLPDLVPVAKEVTVAIPPLEPPPLPPSLSPDIDISCIVSQRLSAMRRLQENPFDIKALGEMNQINQQAQSWVQSKQQPGLFTGSTGANILSHSQLSSGYQAWAKKNQLQTAAPLTGGMGMHLLQKMGWKPGEGLGKEKTGTLEPLLLEVKLDKKGLVANEETRKKKQKVAVPTSNAPVVVSGKHPVSLLGEYATKNKIPPPVYECCFECGPDHKKNFLFKVLLNGAEYKPNVASKSKKEAKAVAARLCLEQLGLLQT